MTFDKGKFTGEMQVAPSSEVQGVRNVLKELSKEKYLKAFEGVLGSATPLFIQSARNVLLDPKNEALAACQPDTLLRSLMECAVTGLSIEPAFGEAAIVPFNSKDGKVATFMPMRNGLVKLANNAGNLARLNATKVYKGDIASHNPFTGDYVYNEEPHDRKVVIGYMAYGRLLNGNDHYIFWPIEKIKEHGAKYSKTYSYKSSLWQTNFEAMAEKTVLRQLLLHWLGTSRNVNEKLWLALRFDSAVPDSFDVLNARLTYPDAPDSKSEIETATAEEVDI